MKTDFTATGRRTWKGALKDGYNGVKRFFLGNFYDNRDQVIFYIYLGFYWFQFRKAQTSKEWEAKN